MSIEIIPDSLEGPEIAALLESHAQLMLTLSPPGTCHFLPLESLRDPAVSVWSMWESGELLGCGALKTLDEKTVEIKSMHTRADQRGRGLGRLMLEHILEEARKRGVSRIYLETGASDGFIPARDLYAAYGFTECGPFADYETSPHSVFMTRVLT